MPRLANGLIITPQLTQRNVTVDLKFSPSVGILARKLDTLGVKVRSFREPLKESVQEVMIPSIRRNFDAGGRPAWEPLAQRTIIQKGGDARPLIRSGNLRRQMGYLKIWTIDSEKAMITDLPASIWYGKVHQGGGSFAVRAGEADLEAIRAALAALGRTFSGDAGMNRGEIPARPFVMVQPEDERAIEQIFDLWVARKIAEAGL